MNNFANDYLGNIPPSNNEVVVNSYMGNVISNKIKADNSKKIEDMPCDINNMSKE